MDTAFSCIYISTKLAEASSPTEVSAILSDLSIQAPPAPPELVVSLSFLIIPFIPSHVFSSISCVIS